MDSDIQRIINEIKLSAEEIVSESPDQIKAVYVMDKEGTVIAYTTNTTLANTGDMFFAMPRFISSLKGLLTTLPIGSIDYILIQGAEDIVQLIGIREIGYLMVIVNSESSIGLTRVILEKYTNRLYELLNKLTGASEEELVEVVNVEITPKDIEDVISFIRSKAML